MPFSRNPTLEQFDVFRIRVVQTQVIQILLPRPESLAPVAGVLEVKTEEPGELPGVDRAVSPVT
jgi:hypothetical protein